MNKLISIVVLKYEKKKTKRHKDKIEFVISTWNKNGTTQPNLKFKPGDEVLYVAQNANTFFKNGIEEFDVWYDEFSEVQKNVARRTHFAAETAKKINSHEKENKKTRKTK